MDHGELAAWLRLALTWGVGNATARRLLAAFGLPTSIFRQTAVALGQVVTAAEAQALLTEPRGFSDKLAATWAWLNEASPHVERRIVTLGDPAYPPELLATADPPVMLYLLGQIPSTWPACIAMVGSRNPTPQGLTNAKEFARSFSQVGLTVVSGMALGIDA
ncbi:MAG: DNA-processing protein DprA, partial [Pseudomonadota bacterium]